MRAIRGLEKRCEHGKCNVFIDVCQTYIFIDAVLIRTDDEDALIGTTGGIAGTGGVDRNCPGIMNGRDPPWGGVTVEAARLGGADAEGKIPRARRAAIKGFSDEEVGGVLLAEGT